MIDKLIHMDIDIIS